MVFRKIKAWLIAHQEKQWDKQIAKAHKELFSDNKVSYEDFRFFVKSIRPNEPKKMYF